jgi:hypothetical protein
VRIPGGLIGHKFHGMIIHCQDYPKKVLTDLIHKYDTHYHLMVTNKP